jgi:N-acetylglucosamine-6-phosphate deacetylase
MHRPICITGGKLVLEESVLEDGAVVLMEGRIAYAGPADLVPPAIAPPGGEAVPFSEWERYDAQGAWVFPGFVDVHIHGGGGADTMDGTVEALRRIASLHAAHGTTCVLATTTTESQERIVAAARAVREAMALSKEDGWHGASIAGMHLEGPYINPKRAGAQNPAYIRPASVAELEEVMAILEEGFRLVTLAPEMEGAKEAIEFLRRAGVAVSMGHTDATFEQAKAGFDAGITHVTHTYNAMRPLHHRDPGVVGAAFLSGPEVRCEVIADGVHVHAKAIEALWRAKGTDGICLVTDAIAAAGMPEGEYELGRLQVTVKGRECRLADGTLAGSVLTMDQAVGFMVREVGVPVHEAAQMAALNPAREAGLDARKGSLRVGKDADVAVLDADFRTVATWVGGRRVFGDPA